MQKWYNEAQMKFTQMKYTLQGMLLHFDVIFLRDCNMQ